MGSREEILAALRAAVVPAQPLPEDRPVAAVRYADPVARLAQALQAVGGELVRASSGAELARAVAALAERVHATRIVSEVPEAGPGTVRLAEVAEPHALEGVQLAVLPGAFAVAETGAVWLPTAGLRHRGIFVIAEHLALVLPAGAIVNDMHQAYARLHFEGRSFGVFIDGPSKTADIEQALVIGAHGPRSCTVFVVG